MTRVQFGMTLLIYWPSMDKLSISETKTTFTLEQKFPICQKYPDSLFFKYTDPRGVYTTQPDTAMVNIT